MKNVLFSMFLLLGLSTTLKSAFADDFLTAEEIEQSNLSATGKGMAAAALLTNPVIECVSTNEGIGADSERLRIYYFEIGNVFKASVAVWKTAGTLRVFGSYDNPESLKNAYEKNQTSVFGTESGQFVNQGLVVEYGQLIPLVGKATKVKFISPSFEAEQICSISK